MYLFLITDFSSYVMYWYVLVLDHWLFILCDVLVITYPYYIATSADVENIYNYHYNKWSVIAETTSEGNR